MTEPCRFLQVLAGARQVGKTTLARQDPERWGRIAASAIGAHLANGAQMDEYQLFYWREGSKEVDFVLRRGDKVLALEVKAGNRRTTLPGIAAFEKAHGPAKKLLLGTGGISFEEFLRISPAALLA